MICNCCGCEVKRLEDFKGIVISEIDGHTSVYRYCPKCQEKGEEKAKALSENGFLIEHKLQPF